MTTSDLRYDLIGNRLRSLGADFATFMVVLSRSTNFDTIIPRWRGKALFSPDLRTHWKYSLPVKRFANFWGARAARPLCHAPRGTLGGLFGGGAESPSRTGGSGRGALAPQPITSFIL